MRGRFGVFTVMKKLNGGGYGVSSAASPEFWPEDSVLKTAVAAFRAPDPVCAKS
jgi:hypothetical protein